MVWGSFWLGLAVAGILPPTGMLHQDLHRRRTPTIDQEPDWRTDVARARISTQTQSAFLAGQTATARVPTLTRTPEKVILGGGGELAFVSDRGDGKTLQIWTMPVYMNNQSQIITGEPQSAHLQ